MINSIFFHLKRLRFLYVYRKRFKKFAKNSYIDSPLNLQGIEYVSISSHTHISKYAWIGCYKDNSGTDPSLDILRGVRIGNFCHISCVSKITIGENVLIADKVTIADSTHQYEDISTPIINQPFGKLRDVSIGEGSWIADNCCVLGARIGKQCVIGAGSVVTHDIPDYSVAVGNPATVVKRYNFISLRWERVNL